MKPLIVLMVLAGCSQTYETPPVYDGSHFAGIHAIQPARSRVKCEIIDSKTVECVK